MSCKQCSKCFLQFALLRKQCSLGAKLLFHKETQLLAEFAYGKRIARRIVCKRSWPAVTKREHALCGNEEKSFSFCLSPPGCNLYEVYWPAIPSNVALAAPNGSHTLSKIDIEKFRQFSSPV